VGCVVASVNAVDSNLSCDQFTASAVASSPVASAVTVGDSVIESDSATVCYTDLLHDSSITNVHPSNCIKNNDAGRHNGGTSESSSDITLCCANERNGEVNKDMGHFAGVSNHKMNNLELSSVVKAEVVCFDEELNGKSKPVEKLTGNSDEEYKLTADNGACVEKIACISKNERTKSRKALKPMKRGQEEEEINVIDKPVEINCAQLLALKCKTCSFTCCSDEQLLMHENSGHNVTSTTMQPFVCRQCKYTTELRGEFERHVAHHTGQHTVRYYQCPYCYYDTNNMMCIESHITEGHASESFRFEVMQETIFYLQRLLDCPICHGVYQWRRDFLAHIRDSHCLESLANHLETMYDEQPFPTSLTAPRSLFKDLLLPTQENEDCVTCQPTAVDDVTDSEDEADAEEIDTNAWASDAMNVELCDSGLNIRFHCSACDYSSEDYNAYQQHTRIHSTGCSESKHVPLNSGSLVISAGATNLLNAGSLGSKGIAKTVYQCHLCPFECLKQVHYRRHLAIHERTERLTNGYQCGYCHFAHNRRNCVKFHLGKYHGDNPIKMSRIVDGVVVELSETDLYALRTRRRKCGSKFVGPTMVPSLVVGPSDRERQSFKKYSSSMQASDYSFSSLNSNTAVKHRNLRTECEDAIQSLIQDELENFKQQLPYAMIYPDPVKCPKCDFTNRVRVNIINHLKLHKEEKDFGGDITSLEDSLSGQCDNSSLGAGVFLAHSDGSPDDLDAAFMASVSRRETLYSSLSSADEKPLLRRILSEKPLVRSNLFLCFVLKHVNTIFSIRFPMISFWKMS